MKKKKNPFNRNDHNVQFLIEAEFIPLLAEAIFYKDAEYLSRAITFYAQSAATDFRCWDCEKYYSDCKCEYCADCKFNRCLCNISDKKVSQVAWEFAEKTLNAAELDKLSETVDLYYSGAIRRKKNPSFRMTQWKKSLINKW